jgi:hypothetical protein
MDKIRDFFGNYVHKFNSSGLSSLALNANITLRHHDYEGLRCYQHSKDDRPPIINIHKKRANVNGQIYTILRATRGLSADPR